MSFSQIQVYVDIVSQVFFALMIMATIMVRIPAFRKYSGDVSGFGAKAMKVLGFLPTLGINPHTKALESALSELQTQASAPVVVTAPVVEKVEETPAK